MNQHLSEPLNKYLERLVEKESWIKWWEDLEPGKLIELKKVEITNKKVGWINFLLNELRP